MRHEPSLNEEADVDIDVDSDSGNVKEEDDVNKNFALEDHIVYFDYPISEDLVELPYKVENESEEIFYSLEEPAAETSVEKSPTENENCVKEEFSNSQDKTYVSESLELHDSQGVELYVDVIESEVSVFTDGFVTEHGQEVSADAEKEPHIFKGDLVTPSGRVMTVIVDDMPTIYPSVSNVGKYLLVIYSCFTNCPNSFQSIRFLVVVR